MNEETVCAVVVTYNRKELLIECLEALENQTRLLDAIYIMDNASTDGTPELLLEKGYIGELPTTELEENFEKTIKKCKITIHYLRMSKNTGGAGGFHEGIKNAYENGYKWFWLMDDDTITNHNSLEVMLNKLEVIEEPVGFLCSKVMWNDEVHFQNLPTVQKLNSSNIPFNKYDKKKLLLLECSTFVSNLISRNAVSELGLPLKEFFIWVDDIEYTKRITDKGFLGLYVQDSIVYHKTNENYSGAELELINEENLWKHYYGRRNGLYILKINNKFHFIIDFIFCLTIFNFNIITSN
ncbi:MAG: glycosyltransferase family 2 protein, partial [Methanobacterium paludis]|nr:glycosyltransferase family 2 protein [Methanobacterium paludis]